MYDEDCESVIAQMTEDYVRGEISLEIFEEYVENRLQGRTPMREDGWPIYYEYDMLNNGIYYYL